MSRNGGQASGAALRADCNVIWLPGMARARSTANSAIPSLTHTGIPGRVSYAAGVMACLAGQAAALPLLTAAGASGDPWAAGAAFGMAAAFASWAGARIAGRFAESAASPSRAAPQDLALHDAFTLALVLAASAVLGAGAALLLPAGALLALTIRRMARMRGYSQGDAILLLAAGIAMAGLCRPLGLQECALAGLALAAVAVMKAGHGCLRLPRWQMWHVWGASALLCAAIAAGGQGPAALPASLGLALGVPLLAGAIYGASAGVLSRMLSGTNARALPAAVPFLSVAAECAIGGSAHLPQVAAAAILLAAAAAGSRRLPAPPCELAVSSPNGWPMGWV